MRRILIAYDGSAAARRGLERAAAIADGTPAVLIVTVVPYLYPLRRAGETVDPRERDEARQLLADARDVLARAGIAAQTRELAGDAAKAIISTAGEMHADLVVVGARGRSPIAHLVLGSVSAQVVKDAPCDVLVVR